jgi:hypothetical protein
MADKLLVKLVPGGNPGYFSGIPAGLGNVCVGCKLISKKQQILTSVGKQIINSEIVAPLFPGKY